VAASYRDGRWDDPEAPVLVLGLDGLSAAIANFAGHSIYGWEFVNCPESRLARWNDRLSLDVRLAGRGTQTLDLFQVDGRRILDLRIWFAELAVLTASGEAIEVAEFIAGGVRWWDALHAGEPRTSGRGIYPAG
jgi:hypothetical protein